MNQYRIKSIRLQTGERLPLLIDSSGIPLFEPTVFAISVLRGRNLASNTIKQALRGVMVLQTMLDRESINLDRRFEQGEFLTYGEIDRLVALTKLEMDAIWEIDKPIGQPRKMISLEQARLNLTRKKAMGEVEPGTSAIRLIYIRKYLVWFANSRIMRMHQGSNRSDMIELRDLVLSAIEERTPSSRGRSGEPERMGLTPESQKILMEIIEPDHLNNPWDTSHSKERNALIVHMMIELGLRRGELLGVRINDIKSNELYVARRPDDELDSRLDEPNAKTKARPIPLSRALSQRIYEYVNGTRYAIKAARKKPMLIVSEEGQELSLSSVNKLFVPLQQSSSLLNFLTPHILRHTFNDNLYESLDKAGMSQVEIRKAMIRLNGWSDNSNSPDYYTKRSTMRRAHSAQITYQNNISMVEKNEVCR
ncbi:MAG: site-specific integrase [Methylophilus sp.]|uniref:site-specific integrase n=2 Tax=Methylophilus sp. TaxID=29541 RepID=UPI0040353AC0